MTPIYLKFYDHSMGTSADLKPAVCEVLGWAVHEDSLHYKVVSWVSDGNPHDANSEAFCVLKSAIISKVKVKHDDK